MKVWQLIELLRRCDPQAEVVTEGCVAGVDAGIVRCAASNVQASHEFRDCIGASVSVADHFGDVMIERSRGYNSMLPPERRRRGGTMDGSIKSTDQPRVISVESGWWICSDCGASAQSPEGVTHFPTCEPGSSERWRRSYQDFAERTFISVPEKHAVEVDHLLAVDAQRELDRFTSGWFSSLDPDVRRRCVRAVADGVRLEHVTIAEATRRFVMDALSVHADVSGLIRVNRKLWSVIVDVRERAGRLLWKTRNHQPGHVCDYRAALQSIKDVTKLALSRTPRVLETRGRAT